MVSSLRHSKPRVNKFLGEHGSLTKGQPTRALMPLIPGTPQSLLQACTAFVANQNACPTMSRTFKAATVYIQSPDPL